MEDILKVYNSLSGQYYLLHYYTWERKDCIILADSKESLEKGVKVIFKDREAKVKGLFKIEMVSPPLSIVEDYKQHIKDLEIRKFCVEVYSYFDYLFSQNLIKEKEIPKYLIKDDKNKCYTFELNSNISKEDFYNKYSEKYYSHFPDPYKSSCKRFFDDKLLHSKAPQANENEKIYTLIYDSNDCLRFHKAYKKSYRYDYFYDYFLEELSRNSPLFYYKILEKLKYSNYSKIAREIIKLKKKEAEVYAKNKEKENLEKDKQLKKTLLEIFKE